MRPLALIIVFFLAPAFSPAQSAAADDAKRAPMTVRAIAADFDVCLQAARKNGSDEATSSHYCGCVLDHERDHSRRIGGARTRADTIHTERRCVRFAFNQPKTFGGGATASTADDKRVSSASIIGQLRACAADGKTEAACECAAERSRVIFHDVGRKATQSLLAERGYVEEAHAACQASASTTTRTSRQR